MAKREFNFINLTTGLEFLPHVQADAYCRFQSSQLESKAWQAFLDSADYHFLYLLATGHSIVIYDCGSRRVDGCPRVIWQGIPFLTHVLSSCWRLPLQRTLVKDANVTGFFDGVYERLDRSKIRYFRKHLDTASINLSGQYQKSVLDGRIAA